jgi:hypothetical protein
MTDTPATFRAGATYFRNARDWAKEQRDDAITLANTKESLSRGGEVVRESEGEESEETQNKVESSGEESEEVGEEDADAESSSTLPSFAIGITAQLLSTPTESDSDTTEDCVRSSTKRSPSQSPKIRRRKRNPGRVSDQWL